MKLEVANYGPKLENGKKGRYAPLRWSTDVSVLLIDLSSRPFLYGQIESAYPAWVEET